jgi:hypothetical protein
VKEGVLVRDPLTRTAIALADGSSRPVNFRSSDLLSTSHSQYQLSNGAGDVASSSSLLSGDARYEDGPMLIIESEHPYRNNTNEFTTVAIPSAISYSITFHSDTKTEAIHDYVKFYDDMTRSFYFGSGKYSGGTNGSPYNWPGIENRPPLIIPSSKFVIHFKTNGSINDWGFRMQIIPKLLVNNNGGMEHSFENNSFKDSPSIPNITDAAKHLRVNEKVHERLYKHAVTKHAESHNQMVNNSHSLLFLSLSTSLFVFLLCSFCHSFSD